MDGLPLEEFLEGNQLALVILKRDRLDPLSAATGIRRP